MNSERRAPCSSASYSGLTLEMNSRAAASDGSEATKAVMRVVNSGKLCVRCVKNGHISDSKPGSSVWKRSSVRKKKP